MASARLCLSKALAGRAPALVRPAAGSSHGGLDLRSLFSSEAAEGTGMTPFTGKTSRREVAVADPFLVREKTVKDEHGGGGGEWWSASSYGCYHAGLLLPEDARAEVKDGVLYVSVPRAPGRERNVTEVEVQ